VVNGGFPKDETKSQQGSAAAGGVASYRGLRRVPPGVGSKDVHALSCRMVAERGQAGRSSNGWCNSPLHVCCANLNFVQQFKKKKSSNRLQ